MGYAATLPEKNEHSIYYSGEDTVVTPNDSEIDCAKIVGILVSQSPLYIQEREASVDPSRVDYSNREKSGSSSSFFRSSTGKIAPEFTLKKKKVKFRALFRHGENFTERQQVQEVLELQARKFYLDSLKENFVREFLINKEFMFLRGKIRKISAGIESCAQG